LISSAPGRFRWRGFALKGFLALLGMFREWRLYKRLASSRSMAGSLWDQIEPLLLRVERPSRYLGCEWNAPKVKEGDFRVVVAYPDIYEVGVSNLGLAIIQEVVNLLDGVSCERVFSPSTDMEEELRKEKIPLFSLESHRPVGSCDIFGISIPHELTYTNILNLIYLANLPVRASEREDGPIIVGGGYGTVNPEPLADFFDLFVLGEAEESFAELVELVKALKGKKGRQEIIEEASKIPGIYRPIDFEFSYLEDGRIAAVRFRGGENASLKKRLVDLDKHLRPSRPIVPFCEAVHDRLNVEIFRGCTRGCRFCQAGMVYRPVRERSAHLVERMIQEALQITGYDEVSLCSLSSTDYTEIKRVVSDLKNICKRMQVNITLPSLRMDGFSVEIASGLNAAGSITFAPEAATERLRRVLNKPIGEAEMIEAVVKAVRHGKRRIKLYFMIGLPTETDKDVSEIPKLIFRLRDAIRAEGLAPPAFNISVSSFVPKAHTPFQWCAQETLASLEGKQRMLRSALQVRGVNLSWHDRYMSTVEGLLSRGDRRLGRVIETAWRKGAKFDSWSEHFRFSVWEESCLENGVDIEFYLHRERDPDEIFPWDHLHFGPSKDFLFREYRRALSSELTVDCRFGDCYGCGACENNKKSHLLKGERI